MNYDDDPDELDRRLAELVTQDDDEAEYEALRDRADDLSDDPDEFDRRYPGDA